MYDISIICLAVGLSVCLSVCLYSYLSQILNETMRWAVVAPLAYRAEGKDTVISGHHVPAGVPYFCYYYYIKYIYIPQIRQNAPAYICIVTVIELTACAQLIVLPFYRHFIIFTARCYASAVLPSQAVRLSVCVFDLWSYRFNCLENKYTYS